jgi:hypothetical protein
MIRMREEAVVAYSKVLSRHSHDRCQKTHDKPLCPEIFEPNWPTCQTHACLIAAYK